MSNDSPDANDALRTRVRDAIRKHGSVAVARALGVDRIAALGLAAEADTRRGTILIAAANVGRLDDLDREVQR